jgi:putative transposase
MDYVSKNHSKYCLSCHLIFVCKYRKDLLVLLGAEIKQLLSDIANEHDVKIIEMEVDKNHIHLLIEYAPKQSVLEIVRLLKQISTYRIWRQNGNAAFLKKHF